MTAGLRLAAGLVLLLAACATPPPASPPPRTVSFAELAPIRLDVAGIRTVVEYLPPFAPPHVEHLAPVAPAAAARQWADDVLVPTGSLREAVFVITDAGMILEEGPAPASLLQSLFRTEQDERYRIEMTARLEIREAGRVLASAAATVVLARSQPRAHSLTARDTALYRQVVQAAGEFDQAIRPEIRRHLSAYLAR